MDVTEFGLTLGDAARDQRALNLRVREAVRDFEESVRQRQEARGHRFSIVRALKAMSTRGLTDGLEAEVAQEMARRAGRHPDPNKVILPWSCIMDRSLQVGTDASGGYLLGLSVPTIGEALRGFSVAFDAGITTLSGLRNDVQIPREAAAGTGYWVAELGTTTESAPTFDAASLSPKHAAAYVEVGKQLLIQAPGVDNFVGRSLRRTLGQLLDTAVISGTGTTEPVGLLNNADLTVTTGTDLSYAQLLIEQESLAAAYVTEANHRWIGSPDVRTTLGVRAVGTAGGEAPFCWQDDKILNRPAYATPACGTQTLLTGDFGQAVLGLWTDGFELQINPYANFQANIVGVKVVLSCDLAVLNNNAIRIVSDIT